MRMIELVRMGVGLKASKMAEWIIVQGHHVGKKADVSRIKPVCWSPHNNAVFGGNIDSSEFGGEYRRSSSNTVVDLFALVL